MPSSRNTGKLKGMFTSHVVNVSLVKSLATGEKRYVPRVGEKELRLSWKTRLYAETYGNVVASRCKRMAELTNKQLRKKKESENV